ncbi:hypothetical protein AX15_005049 [Amanita polypyramis BW_CC]|nr:hypothetical protein AX15_005049 [Amanita polypyramis BW_CC]
MLLLAAWCLIQWQFHFASAATADQWRTRSIYQIMTDRYALPPGADPTRCDPGQQTWCGGTWNTIRENLDYVQNAGFTAIWISPVNQNYEGPRTAYGDPYHGYWIADATQLNEHFGTSGDLKALSAELHRRDMYLMLDVVVNNVMAISISPDYSPYMFKDASFYHPYCPIQWGNTTSEQICWLGDTTIPLPDLDTTHPVVKQRYGQWIADLVKEYNIDGLRIDAAKHVQMDFWPEFCSNAGVFCIGEVFGSTDVGSAAMYQGAHALDSVLNFPMYSALTTAFTIPGPQNMSAFVDIFQQSREDFKDIGLLGNFLENQDLPRWHNLSVDPQSLCNAMAITFMTDGIPIVYYGQEQGFFGNQDPFNREPLWPSRYAKSSGYNFTAALNMFRNFLVKNTDWGQVITIATNIGSPPQDRIHIAVSTLYPASSVLMNILTCKQWIVGASGTIEAEYTKGGAVIILVPVSLLEESGICGSVVTAESSSGITASAGHITSISYWFTVITLVVMFILM